MSNFRYSPPNPIFGPWLLKAESLRKLDEIVGKHWIRIEEAKDRRKAELLNEFRENFLKENHLTQLTKEYKSQYNERLLAYENYLRGWNSGRKLRNYLKR